MHLVRTGAFLKAVRVARLAPLRGRNVEALRYLATDQRVRPLKFQRPPLIDVRRPVISDLNPVDTESADALESEEDNVINGTSEAAEHQTPSKDHAATTSSSSKNIFGKSYPSDDTTNVTDTITALVGRKLYDNPDHPIAITKALVESVFRAPTFRNHIASNPVVSTRDNFDVLGFPQDHPGRSKTDTYYIDEKTVLRTHSSAHQHVAFQKIAAGWPGGYTICADVYRRDSIDRTHFPVFHQMEGALTWKLEQPDPSTQSRLQRQYKRTQTIQQGLRSLPEHDMVVSDPSGHSNEETNPVQLEHDVEESEAVAQHLKKSLEQLVYAVFTAAQEARPDQKQERMQVRWVEAYFPFTSPSFELEVLWQGEWLELLGCGVVKQTILNNAGLKDRIAWAWGIGLERLAMILFEIPDIRLFWSEDERFLKQFQQGKITRFVPYSKYPPSPRDVSFWIHGSPGTASPLSEQSGTAVAAGGDATKASPTETQDAAFHENDFMEIVRDVAGSLAEDVKLVDEFVHPRTGKKSLCYRVVYRSHDRTLENSEVNALHEQLLERVKNLPVEIR